MNKPSLSATRSLKAFFIEGQSLHSATVASIMATLLVVAFAPATSLGVTLSVSNAYGTAIPAAGDHVLASGTSIICRVTDSPISLGSGTQRMCSGWSGSGSVPAAGSATNVSATVTNDSSITWNWSVQYGITITRIGNGRVTPDIHWYDTGSSTTLVAVADEHCTFLGWSGDTNGATVNSNQVTLPIDRTRMITAHFSGGPWAYEVVDYTAGTNVPNDFFTGEPFTNAWSALGRPTRSGAFGDITVFSSPFALDEVVSVGALGELCLAFDHPVSNDMYNPGGYDLIVFGNSFFFDASATFTGVAGTAFSDEPGAISVSQDGTNWVIITNATADGLFPSQGYTDTTTPYGGGGTSPTDFLKPVDPSVHWTNSAYLDIVARYDGAGGGTAVDIAPTGLEWIRYVKITQGSNDAWTTEIDGVADVAPDVPPFSHTNIMFWAGYGTNTSYLVIDWNDGKAPVSLAWGFLWNGSKSGREMIEAITNADARLFAAIRNVTFNDILFGAGYDIDQDGGGYNATGPGDESGSANDADDHYGEGWELTSFWFYAISPDNPYHPDSWSPSGAGFDTRQLADGSWDGWRYSPFTIPPSNTPPALPAAATGLSTSQVTLAVTSAYAVTVPPPGTLTTNIGVCFVAAVTNSPITLSPGLRVVSTGWTANGSLPPSGSATATWPFGLTRHSSITWHWQTQVWLNLSVSGAGTVTGAGGWFVLGSNANLAAVAAPYHHFAHWSGDVPAAATNMPTIQLLMDMPRNVTANFATNSPFAVTVFGSASLGSGETGVAALGPPTVDTTAEATQMQIGLTNVPVVPVFPAWQDDELTTILSGGHLSLCFDHKVEDDPRNPYGLDLIVFGNAFHQLGGTFWDYADPSNTVIASGSFSKEPATVAVSQDGATWFTFTNGPFADDFAPTLGRLYDPANPATNLGTWNLWWGAPTDPTRPHDPAIVPSNYTGASIAQIARYYGRSAGGTGFDIGSFAALPATSPHSNKWIRYVRVTASALGTTPEVDAVSDVAPVGNFERWRIENFSWTELAAPAVSGPAADPGGNGAANLVDYALGDNPHASNAAPVFVDGGVTNIMGSNYWTIVYCRNTNAVDVEIRVVGAATAFGPVWQTGDVMQAWQVLPASNGIEKVVARVPLNSATQRILRLQVQLP